MAFAASWLPQRRLLAARVNHERVVKGTRKRSRPSRARRGLTPGPSGLPLPPAEPVWRLQLAMYGWLAFTVLAGIGFCIGAGIVVRDEVALDLDHRHTVGRVIDVHTSIRGPGSVRVSYLADGRQVEATVEQPWIGRDADIDDEVRIEYLASDPMVARRAGAHDLVGVVVAFGVPALFAIASTLLRRRYAA
ncbi:hypothetical protein Q2K19_32155 [Micromonospora soli]|uniref:hypothetical protein n=1 Tax=Micromonospora sp. NBRC 110009 TaxID=3061627 RepID=UPI002671BED5|nr:hypothetical protein [Micromonospora sp. NBRC 110009]WKT98738.1 hypothetical protein Q2K19_32155 [Micromonospora sp. NBRC 110009]